MNDGTCVMFRSAHGSIGKIESGRRFDDGYYVRWNYGKDVNGDPIMSLSSVARRDVVEIPQELHDEYVACRAWSDAQKPIQQKILSAVTVAMGWKT